MKKRVFSARRSAFALESLEHRQMLSASDMPTLVGLNALRANYPTIRGQGQVVVVLDTGVNDTYGNTNLLHPAFTNPDGSSKLWTGTAEDFVPGGGSTPVHGWNYVDGNSDIHDPGIGHGTAIASVIASAPHTFNDPNAGDTTAIYQGVAPDAKILPIKVYDWDSTGQTWADGADLNKAFKWIWSHATTLHIASVNMSWGFFGSASEADYTNDPDGSATAEHSIQWYIDDLETNKGVLFVQAVGNEDKSVMALPAREPEETGVSSLNESGSSYWDNTPTTSVSQTGTSYGDANFVDIYAPGWNVTANSQDAGYTLQPGWTSFATPWIAGAAALLKQVNPSLTAAQMMTILKNNNAGQVTDSRSGTAITHPILDLNKAMGAAIQQMPAGQAGSANDIKYDSSGNLHMVWYSDSAKAIFYAKRTASTGTWSTTEIVDAGKASGSGAESHDLGIYQSLAVDASGNPRVAYYDSYNGDLRYAARSSGGAWSIQTLDATNTTGSYPSLKLASNGRAAVSYYSSNAGDLRFIQQNSDLTTWAAPVTAVSTNDSGRYSRNAVDPTTGRWVIAYDDTSAGNAMYVRQTSTGAWDAPTTIDAFTNFSAAEAAFTDIQFDGNNRPAVSYYDTFNGDLRFATANDVSGSAWSYGLVSGNVNKGLYTNLHFAGMSGSAALWDIIYYNKAAGSVERAKNTAALSLLQPDPITGLPTIATWQGFNITTVASDGGAEISADWFGSGATGKFSLAYGKNDGTGVKAVADLPI